MVGPYDVSYAGEFGAVARGGKVISLSLPAGGDAKKPVVA